MANVKTYSRAKDGGTKLSTNFSAKEFACKDGSDYILIDADLVTILQKIRSHFGKAITITSAYRNATYNAKVGGASNSYHTKGQAADIVISGVALNDIAAYAESIGALGVMRYDTSGFVHIDTRTAKYFATVKNGVTSTVSTFGGTASGSTANTATQTAGIKQFQTWLNSFGGYGLVVDGGFGAKTRTAAIKAMQKVIGVTADGVWGIKSQTACLTLQKGSMGSAVYILQGMLYCRGSVYSGFDGLYGSGTESEVKAYQLAKGLTADGKTGKSTFTKLFA